MARRSALGKGLGAFFGDDVVRTANEISSEKRKEHSVKNVEQDQLKKLNAESSTDLQQTSTQNLETDSRKKLNQVLPRDVKSDDIKNQPAEISGTVLLDQNLADKKAEKAAEDTENSDVSRETLVKLSKIEPNEEQPRKKFDEESLQELADSIKEYGILQPLLVKKNGDMYRIIAGERRWRAAKTAGLKEVPVIIREYDRQQSVEIALIENVQRADLNPIEEAFAYQQLMQEFGLKQEEIASRVAKNRATITNSIRLLKLAAPVQKLLIDGQISSGHARALLGIDDAEKQIQVAKDVVEKGLSVREVEKLVKAMSKPPKEKKEKEEERDLSFIFQDLEDRMKGIMGTKVMIHQKDKNKGRIEIEYYSPSELERIVELIESIR